MSNKIVFGIVIFGVVIFATLSFLRDIKNDQQAADAATAAAIADCHASGATNCEELWTK